MKKKRTNALAPVATLEELQQAVQSHAQNLKEKYGLKVIGVIGSFRRGEQREKSDIDLLAEPERPISLLELAGAEIFLSEVLGIKVDLVPKDDIRQELKDQILREALYW